MATILVTTDDLESAGRLQKALEPEAEVRFVTGPEDVRQALAQLGDAPCALILTGRAAAGPASGIRATFSEERPYMPVVALLEQGEGVPEGPAVELAPADEVFAKPVDPDEVALVVHRLIQRRRLQADLGIVGNAEAIREVVERVAQIAPVGSTVLITGESGTGKELVARGLHKLSPRRGKGFIAVNIAALPETLLESELFGHEKGAFTGATALRKGMFELANGGTIFLDEVAEMPGSSQTRLLRVLEQREFMRVGGSDSIKVDVRVIAATNRDLRRAVDDHEFRRDLYYRLNVLHIHMPALRERREDIPVLVHEFIRQFSREHQKEFKGIAPDALAMLVRYDWPGNVRELKNLIESMVVLAPGTVIRAEDIPPEVRRGAVRALPSPIAAPALVTRQGAAGEAIAVRLPDMELFFRTLVELKFDVEDLRREFEAFRRRHPELTGAREAAVVEPRRPHAEPIVRETAEVEREGAPAAVAAGSADEGAIVFRPGITMEELERAAITATLKSVNGNRRLASAMLGIGERTLYRKLKEYSLDA
jgi:DNA-binding NtrC family response regulator